MHKDPGASKAVAAQCQSPPARAPHSTGDSTSRCQNKSLRRPNFAGARDLMTGFLSGEGTLQHLDPQGPECKPRRGQGNPDAMGRENRPHIRVAGWAQAGGETWPLHQRTKRVAVR